MDAQVAPFEHDYRPGRFVYGPGRVAELERLLSESGVECVLVVCGTTVGATPAVMKPVLSGIGSRFAGVFAETTTEKRVETVHEGVDRIRSLDADGLVAVGGGSSLDVATVISALHAEGSPIEDLFVSNSEGGTFEVPDLSVPKLPIFAVPTTLVGADITCGAGIYLETGEVGAPGGEVRGGAIYDDKLVPEAVCYDPELLATTPGDVLRRSAMNGFDHGIEMLSSRNATPITDATAIRGLGILRRALPAVGDDTDDVPALGDAMVGVALSTYGLAPSPNTSKIAVVHAFGHALSRNYSVQQGAVHGIVAPHVLRYVFDRTDGRRRKLAAALGVPTEAHDEDELAAGVVDAVTEVRDALGLPTRLQSVTSLRRNHLPELATEVSADPAVDRGPPGLKLSVDDLRRVLERAW